MWQLAMKTPADKDWTPVSTFATVTEAARRIVELQGIPKNGLFLEFYVETNEFGTDDGAFRVFHYTGKRAIKRSHPNRIGIRRHFVVRGGPARISCA
jgi:hypothetical protein